MPVSGFIWRKWQRRWAPDYAERNSVRKSRSSSVLALAPNIPVAPSQHRNSLRRRRSVKTRVIVGSDSRPVSGISSESDRISNAIISSNSPNFGIRDWLLRYLGSIPDVSLIPSESLKNPILTVVIRFGPNHLRAVWRLSLGLGAVPAFIVLLWRLKMDEPARYKSDNMKHARIPYKLVIRRYWAPLTAISAVCFSNLGAGLCTFILAAKACPTGVRGHYFGVAAAVGKLGAFIGIWSEYRFGLQFTMLSKSKSIHPLYRQISNEVLLWGQLRHPNIAPIQGIFHSDDRVFMVSPWMANGDVRMYLSSNPDVPRAPLVMDVGSGLQYLHENSIIHGDLKGPNILIDSAGRAYITDLGISSVTGSHIIGWNYHKPVTSKGGSVRWQAPELFSPDNTSNSMESDVYAWGCVCFEVKLMAFAFPGLNTDIRLQILTGLVPFSHMQNDFAVMMHVSSGGRPARPEHLNSIFGMTDEMWPLMEQCWDADPRKRPSSRDIVYRLSLNFQQENRRIFPDDALFLRQPQKCHILDVDSLDRILQPTVSDEEICLEEDKWNANNVLILSGLKAFFDELDGIFGREAFGSMIGDLDFHRRIKGDLINNLEKRRGTVEDAKERKMRADIEKGEARKRRLDELVRNLEAKLESFTGSATGPKDEHMLKIWKEKCTREA
ncbi:hypothetical protein H0H93_002524, partial [Arthromyces matolae]